MDRAQWIVLVGASLISSIVPAEDTLFFSEYLEGNGYNKALELHNPTTAPVELNEYRLEFYFNGAVEASKTIHLEGIIEPHDSFVIVDGRAEASLLLRADLIATSGWYNGDDSILLKKLDEVIDAIGQLGIDPGVSWEVDGISTRNMDLRRIPVIRTGDKEPTDIYNPALHWLSFAAVDYSDLGNHSLSNTVCGDVFTSLAKVQGDSELSPLLGEFVNVEGVVTLLKNDGYFLQAETHEQDSNPNTSEALFVYHSPVPFSVGERVRVSGTVKEYYGLTELSPVFKQESCGIGQLPVALPLNMPFTSASQLEALESMRVDLGQELIITDVKNVARYGQIAVSSQRLWQPTQQNDPGPGAILLQQQNELDRLLVDDVSETRPLWPIHLPINSTNIIPEYLRSGDRLYDLSGVISYAFGQYVLLPSKGPHIVQERQPMVPEPVDAGEIRVASVNVQNYFTTIDQGESVCGPQMDSACRGADSASEFQTQQQKLLAVIIAIDADVLALMEIENNGYTQESAIATLVKAINSQSAEEDRYRFIDPGRDRLGEDAISVAIIYRPSVFRVIGEPAVLDQGVDIEFLDSWNRPSLAASFRQIGNAQEFTLVANHFKSKGSTCAMLGDFDLEDGQGNCNKTRSNAARALLKWLSSYPTGVRDTDVLIVGDLNAYAKEDPIRILREGGFIDLLTEKDRAGAWSYNYNGVSGYLDHGLASESLSEQTSSAQHWHINADESPVHDYNVESKPIGYPLSLSEASPRRSSDHDPLLVDLKLRAACDIVRDDVLDWRDRWAFLFARLGWWPSFRKYVDMNRDGVINSLDRFLFDRCMNNVRVH